jgi:hypothetical protein
VKQLTEKRSDLEFEKTGKNEVAAFEEGIDFQGFYDKRHDCDTSIIECVLM